MPSQKAPFRSAPISALAVLAAALCLRVAATSSETPPALEIEKERESSPALTAIREGGQVDINIASVEELQLLPRVGPVLAGRIVEGRPYESVDALVDVRGIGPATLERLRPLVSTSSE